AGEVLTTGCWYYRLHRALHDPMSAGSLSTMVANLPAAAKDTLDGLDPYDDALARVAAIDELRAATRKGRTAAPQTAGQRQMIHEYGPGGR
ncbi:MAG: hypothetical protein H0U92_08790, partial [Actinobacteria bacterium]|nr:hypothetical protein [Actinomycetota bacterium]